MTSMLDLGNYATGVLALQHGGSGNDAGLSRGIVLSALYPGSGLVLGNLVRWRVGVPLDQRIAKTTAAGETTVLGVVVGYFKPDGANDADRLIEDDPPANSLVAVQIGGVCDVLVDASGSTVGHYALASATDGMAADSATLAAGVFGRYLQTVASGLARCALLGAVVAGAGGPSLPLGGTAGQVLTKLDATDGNADWRPATGALTITIVVPQAGVYTDVLLPFDGAFVSWTVLNDAAGSITFDVWVDDYAAFPPTVADTVTAANKPKTTTAAKATGACTGWTTAFLAGDVARVNVDSVSGVTRSVLVLEYLRTV